MTEAEKRKLRRRTANRESARRVRDRQTQHSMCVALAVCLRPYNASAEQHCEGFVGPS